MASQTPSKAPDPALRMAIDFGPLIVFFAVNFLVGGEQISRVVAATVAFMTATAIAMAVSQWKTGHISPMLWLSGVLVLVFGGLTIYFHDETFIKIKPTIIYLMFASVLIFGLLTGRPLLQYVLESAYPGLSPKGWRQLTINWALFFVAQAALNETVWRNTSWDFWVAYKLWGVIPMTLIFAVANLPMLMKHGMQVSGDTPPPIPPEG
ncbi:MULTISPECIES: inner membrane-spanning protein YciB [unclassified Sphingomonas]|uniref:septation protein A n=1 Tax=unclassified Sphingomonas TaxID=196159 RepID=UPI000BD15323|nr:MAG: intracellular septation protein A [Sphingomonas sp. 12-62-6]OYX37014.1 MAG: intracellular septation protein A [Sphingomonas sp. 32-62-10]OYY66834.1 MAG: intracellular septation protein A [Sphingomonas sp. 28-62-11]